MRPTVILRKADRSRAGQGTPIPKFPLQSELAATCAGGLEALLEEEVRDLGYSVLRRGAGIVYFRAALGEVTRCITYLRTASRVLVPLERFTVSSYDGLYHRVRALPWEEIIPPAHTFAISSSTRSESMKDHRFLAMRAKDAIVDRQRSAPGGRRSSIDRDHPRFRVSLFVDQTTNVEVSLDAADAPLHERGYRREAGDAPLRETVAAAMLMQAGYRSRVATGKPPLLIDPFCGSGTIAVEAALMLAGRPPQPPGRLFACREWPWFPVSKRPPEVVEETLEEGRGGSSEVHIFASDRDKEVLEYARRNARRAGVEGMIDFRVNSVRDCFPALAEQIGNHTPDVLVLANPPYGERLVQDDLAVLYRDLGALLKAHIPGGKAFILCSEEGLMRRTGIRTVRRLPMYNGGIACKLYELNPR